LNLPRRNTRLASNQFKVSQKVDETILTVKMTDDFPGSPCRHVFALVNEL